ncbi:hypothetical protein B0J13DRAFT_630167 [Dactylonectria estremocensis]|uniref:Tetrapyrrole methylase domain-containing protein n=1 Tax=Dactylonectria estremocensis TaxID=1079267 RepID=A0A9P9DEE5_9HYPO|nr:hypothetical protein B0J13DRAFT_630167 [Dactylonectria estremocensis]
MHGIDTGAACWNCAKNGHTYRPVPVRAHAAGRSGDRVSVLPGVTSALSAPLFAAIPPTQRDVADQVIICTGTGKKGRAPTPPEFVPSRTVVFLMALHRINGLVRELTTAIELEPLAPANEEAASAQPPPPQSHLRTTLEHVAEAIETEGSRPPGLLVVGRACEALFTPEKGRAWAVEEGFREMEIEDFTKGLEALQA